MACGPYNSGLTVQGEVSREDMRRWLLLQLTAGAQTTVLWNTRPEHFWDEAQGQGFLGGRGELTPRADAIREYCAAAATHSDLLATSVKPPSPVAICLDESLYRIADGMDERRAVEMPTRGAYEVLFAAGIDPDFIDIERASDTKLDAHRVLVLPFPFATAPTTIAKLRAYVERGGTVLSGPTPGRFSEYGWAWPPGMVEEAEELCGVRQAGLRHVAEFDGNARWTPDGCRAGDILPPTTLAGAGPLAGLSPKAAYYVQTYDIVTDAAEPILRHGDAVAGVRCRHGAGQACVLGTMFAYSTLGEECRETRRAVEAILTAASVPTERTGSIVRHRRVSPGGELWSLVNLGATDAEWRVPEALDAGPVDFLTGERFGRGDAAMVPAHDLRTLVVR